MIAALDLKQYHRDLALYCLQSADEPMTSGECAELMQTTALSAMHDEPCWKRIDAGKVAGTLKALTNSGQAVKVEPTHNARAGRLQERWVIAKGLERVALPECPFQERPQAIVPIKTQSVDPYAHLTREQLLALVQVQDEASQIVAEFEMRLNAWKVRARTLLASAGAEPA